MFNPFEKEMKNLLTPTHWGIPSRKPWLRPRQAPAGLLLTCGAAPRFVRTAPALQSSPLCPAPGRRRRHSALRLPRGDLSLREKARSRGRLPGSASPASPARRGRPPPPQPRPARGRRCRRLVGAPGAGGLRGGAQRRKVPGRQARRPPERSRGMGTQAAGPGSPPRGSLARRLLAAAVLSCCFLLTQAQDIPVTVNPPQPVEGQEVTLTPGGSPNIFTCNWFRGGDLPPNQIFVYLPSSEQENGPGYTGRETGGSNCSLHIRSLTLNDTGKYTVLKTTSTGLPEKGSVQIQVLAAILSSCFLLTQAQNVLVTLNPPQPKEGQDVTMTPGGSTDLFSVNWFRGEDSEVQVLILFQLHLLKRARERSLASRRGPWLVLCWLESCFNIVSV
ncbi:cell adhesion molecule CEACAM18-like [Paroedura picta]|uniref:cell adhesion molecule CEACAM18-like n=1 Tax=Paroedura picta TaxID=143630 RepID=UPI0040574863